MPKYKTVTLGSDHQGDSRYGIYAGTQCVANVLSFFMYSEQIGADGMRSSDIDNVLQTGNTIYASARRRSTSNYLLPTDLPRVIGEGFWRCEITPVAIFYGEICADLGDLLASLDRAFDIGSTSFFTAKDTCVGLKKVGANYYVFDSHARNRSGYTDAYGKACIIFLPRLHLLAKYLLQQYGDVTSERFQIVACKVQNLDDNYSNRQVTFIDENSYFVDAALEEYVVTSADMIPNASVGSSVGSGHSNYDMALGKEDTTAWKTVVNTRRKSSPKFKGRDAYVKLRLAKQEIVEIGDVNYCASVETNSFGECINVINHVDLCERQYVGKCAPEVTVAKPKNKAEGSRVAAKKKQKLSKLASAANVKRNESDITFLPTTNVVENRNENLDVSHEVKHEYNLRSRKRKQVFEVRTDDIFETDSSPEVVPRKCMQNKSKLKKTPNEVAKDSSPEVLSQKSRQKKKKLRKKQNSTFRNSIAVGIDNDESVLVGPNIDCGEANDEVDINIIDDFVELESSEDERTSAKRQYQADYYIQKGQDRHKRRKNVKAKSNEIRDFASGTSLSAQVIDELNEGCDYVCCVCEQIYFRRSVTCISRYKLPFYRKYIVLFDPDSCYSFYYVCSTCKGSVTTGKVARLSRYNGMALPKIPEVLNITSKEASLISPRIAFLNLHVLPSGCQLSLYGNVVCVPADLEPAICSLPRHINAEGTVSLRIKRRLSYKSVYRHINVRPKLVMSALQWLLQHSDLYKEIDIQIDHKWLEDTIKELTQQIPSVDVPCTESLVESCPNRNEGSSGFEDVIPSSSESNDSGQVLEERSAGCVSSTSVVNNGQNADKDKNCDGAQGSDSDDNFSEVDPNEHNSLLPSMLDEEVDTQYLDVAPGEGNFP